MNRFSASLPALDATTVSIEEAGYDPESGGFAIPMTRDWPEDSAWVVVDPTGGEPQVLEANRRSSSPRARPRRSSCGFEPGAVAEQFDVRPESFPLFASLLPGCYRVLVKGLTGRTIELEVAVPGDADRVEVPVR